MAGWRFTNSALSWLRSWVYSCHLRAQLRASGRRAVLVYQMAKVGSASVYLSLKESLDIPVFHTHYLSETRIASIERKLRRAGAPVPSDLHHSAVLKRHLGQIDRPIVVTLVRDPIAREISLFFQLHGREIEVLRERGEDDEATERLDAILGQIRVRIEDLQDEEHKTVHKAVHRWFDTEMRPVFGIDVYSRPFDSDKGYMVMPGERARLVIFRLENLDRAFENGMREVLESQGVFHLSRVNVGTEKAYAAAYRSVLERIRVPAKVCRAIYATRFGRHFYGDMAERLTEKWSQQAI